MEKVITVMMIVGLSYVLWRFTRGPLMEMMMNYIDKQHSLSHRLMEGVNELCDDVADHEERILKLDAEIRKLKESTVKDKS